ncbi:MAG: phosphoribosylformylglycinamidine cyclo-ligase [Clostridiales bacterium]|nr:phosphoribosylformylglycinamidine cyclo-ligase [Clostridiales bacterium]
MAIDYKSAGVDVERGYEAVKLMKKHVKETYNDSVLGDIGSFGGLYALGEGENADVLVAGTDGVGTKLKYAFVLDKHDTVGIDCVAMCVNDIVCQGAKPLIFLDYIALGRLVPGKVAEIVKGVAEGCKMAGCALIGGETAEMPGFYEGDDYDMAGFSVGIAKRNKIITGERIKAGDRLIGLRSSGVHSNGYSLVRKIFEPNKITLLEYDEELDAIPADVILAPTRIYVKQALSLIENCDVLGMAHITGGGFIENIPRILPEGLAAKIDRSSYELPRLFKVLQHRAEISDEKMYNTFNMGVGLVICVAKEEEEKAIAHLKSIGEDPIRLGEVVEGNGVIL